MDLSGVFIFDWPDKPFCAILNAILNDLFEDSPEVFFFNFPTPKCIQT